MNFERNMAMLAEDLLENIQGLLDESWSYRQVSDETGIKSATIRKVVSEGRLHRTVRNFGLTKSDRTVRDAEAAAGMGTACTRTETKYPGTRLCMVFESAVQATHESR